LEATTWCPSLAHTVISKFPTDSCQNQKFHPNRELVDCWASREHGGCACLPHVLPPPILLRNAIASSLGYMSGATSTQRAAPIRVNRQLSYTNLCTHICWHTLSDADVVTLSLPQTCLWPPAAAAATSSLLRVWFSRRLTRRWTRRWRSALG